MLGVVAPASANSTTWDKLSAKEKKFLQKFHSKWHSFSPQKRKLLKQRANLSKAQWNNIKKFYRKWRKLPKSKRQKLIKVIRDYKKQSPAKKKRLRKMQKWVNSLPPDIRRKFKRKWKTMSEKQLKAYVKQLKEQYPLKK